MKEDNMNTSFLKPGRGKNWTLLLMLLVFISGGVVGGYLTARVIMTRTQEAIRSPSRVPERFARRLTRLLDLNEEQSLQMEIILSRNLKALVPLRREIRTRLLDQMDHTQKEIEVILTPEQKTTLEKRFTRIRERWFKETAARARAVDTQQPGGATP